MSALKNNKSLLANLGLILAAMLWGTSFPFVKIILDVASPMYVMAIRYTIAAVVLVAVFWKKLKGLKPSVLKSGALIGAVLFISNALQTVGCNYTTAGKTAFITTLYVVMTPFICWLFYKKRPTGISVLAALLALIGIGILSLSDDLTVNIGDFLVFLCGIMYAVHIALLAESLTTEDPAQLVVLQIAVNALLSWICAPLFHGSLDFAAIGVASWMTFIYLALFCTVAAFMLQNFCTKYTTASTSALLCSLESVFGVVFSIIILGEQPTPRMFIGFAVVFVAIVIATTGLEFLKKNRR